MGFASTRKIKKFVWTGDKMKAIIVKRENKKPLLLWEKVPDIQCKPDEVLVDVKATAVNRADLLQAMGNTAEMNMGTVLGKSLQNHRLAVTFAALDGKDRHHPTV